MNFHLISAEEYTKKIRELSSDIQYFTIEIGEFGHFQVASDGGLNTWVMKEMIEGSLKRAWERKIDAPALKDKGDAAS